MISKLSAESTIGVGLPSSTVCSSVSFPCIVARVSKSVFHRLLLLLFLPSLHVQPSSELYPSIKLAITPPSIHPFIQLPVGAAWGRVLVGCCRPPPFPFSPVSCPLSWTLFFLFLCRRRRRHRRLSHSLHKTGRHRTATHPQPSPQDAEARRLSLDWWKAE